MTLSVLLVAALAFSGAPSLSRFVPVFVRVEGPPSLAELAILSEHGVHGFLVRASDQESLEALRGRPVLVEGVLPDGNLRLPEGELERYFESYFAVRDPGLTARPACFHRQPVRADLRTAAKTAAAALAAYSPLGLFLVEDPSITSGSDPFDWCYCDACQEIFRARLRARASSDPGLLGRAGVADVSAFLPWTVDQARAGNLDRPRAEVNLFAWLAWRRFLDQSLAMELSSLGGVARYASGSLVGFLGGAPSNPFGGHDWAALASSADILLPPDDPTSRAVCASFVGEGGQLLTSIRSTGGAERIARQKISHHFLTGSGGILFSSLSDLLMEGDRGPAPTVLLNATHEVVQRLEREVLPLAARAKVPPAEVGIFYSPSSLDVLWMKDTEPDGVWWPSRSRRLGQELLPLAGTWWGWQLLLEDAGAPYRFVDGEALAAEGGLAGLRALVLPRAIVLADAEAAGVRRFVAAGGLLLADAETGLFDELGRGRATGALDDVFQIERDDQSLPWDWHPEESRAPDAKAERVLGLREREPLSHAGDTRHLIDRRVGEGRSVYLNLDLSDYVATREARPASAALLVGRLRGWLADAGLSPGVQIEREDGEPLARVKVWRFVEPEGRELLVLARNETLPEMQGDPEDPTPRTYRIRFWGPRQVLNLTEGRASRGAVREVLVEIGPVGWVLLGVR